MKIGRVAALSRSALACGLTVAIALMVGGAAGVSQADPAADAMARMAELSREAERLTEVMYSAELDLDAKSAEQRGAEERSRAETDAADAARAELAIYQNSVDQVAAAAYMGGSTGGARLILTAESPQRLLDELSLSRVMATQMAERMTAFRAASARADVAAEASRTSAEQARTAAEQSSAARAELQARQSRLRAQIAEVEAQYRALTPDQRAVLADPGPVPPAPPPPTDPAIIAMPQGPSPDVPPPGGPSPGGGNGAAVVQAALTRVGSPYSWGATGPNAFDCSGLIKWAFLQNGKSLPRSSQALASGGQAVSVADLQPGDIVTFYSDASHAGIYIGGGDMVHASTFGTPVKVAPISSAPIYNARRY